MSRGLDVESSFYLRVIDPNYLYSSHPYYHSVLKLSTWLSLAKTGLKFFL